MKRMMFFIVLLSLSLLLVQNVAFAAADPSTPVGRDGKTTEEQATSEKESPVVGEDIEIGEGELKIVSIGEAEPVVGEDINVGEGEAKIVSIGEPESKPVGEERQSGPVVGEDINVGEGEAKIVSIGAPAEETKETNVVYYVIIGIVFLTAAFLGRLTYKKLAVSKP